MLINNYIMKGGENFNSPSIVTGVLSPEATRIFLHCFDQLASNTVEERYIECPIDSNNRLFVRAIWSDWSGTRSECYVFGFLVPRSFYEESAEYYCVNRGLCAISLQAILSASKSKQPNKRVVFLQTANSTQKAHRP